MVCIDYRKLLESNHYRT